MSHDIQEDSKRVTPALVQSEKMLTIAAAGQAAVIFIDPKGKDYDGLKLVASSFAEDVNMVSGVTPAIVTDVGGGTIPGIHS